MSRHSAGVLQQGSTVVTLPTGTTALTPEEHANRLLQISTAAAAYTLNLPRAYGTGDTYEFLLTVAHTSGSIIINAPAGVPSNVFVGTIFNQTSANILTRFSSTVNDIITLNNTTTGGVAAGDYIKLQDVAPNTWRVVRGLVTSSGAQATPFSG